MCPFQQLYINETGYVVRCNECGYYQILFSSTLLSITEAEFKTFLIQIAFQKQNHEINNPQLKSLVIPTPRNGVHLMLSVNEFHELLHMMESAEAEVKTLALLDLFTNQT